MGFVVAAVADMGDMRNMGREPGRAAALGFCVLVARLDFLVEASSLLLIGKRETGHAVLELEGVEKGPIVVVSEALVELLIPDHALVGLNWVVSIARTWAGIEGDGGTYDDINNLEEERVPDEILGKHHGATDSGEVPSVFVGVVDVETGDGDGDDVV